MFHLETQATLQAIPAALAKAHQVYGIKDSKVVFVVNEDGRNFADWCQVRMEEIGRKLVMFLRMIHGHSVIVVLSLFCFLVSF